MTKIAHPAPTVIALSGGVGGAKLVLGLSRVVDAGALLVVANTADDFEHLGLHVAPDLDTLTYTLAGIANPETGWGRTEETATFMAALEALGGETWFHLGDADLATHVERTRRLKAGQTLTAVTADFCTRLGIDTHIVPMSDDPVQTVVETSDGPLAFQHYFVRDGCRPVAKGFRFDGIAAARPNPLFLEALAEANLAAVVICPSNPFISVDPILALRGVRTALSDCPAPVIAVSPIVGGRALKGPTAKMMHELGMASTAVSVASHYRGLLDGFVVDTEDADLAGEIDEMGMAVLATPTVMDSLQDRESLARDVLEFARACRR